MPSFDKAHSQNFFSTILLNPLRNTNCITRKPFTKRINLSSFVNVIGFFHQGIFYFIKIRINVTPFFNDAFSQRFCHSHVRTNGFSNIWILNFNRCLSTIFQLRSVNLTNRGRRKRLSIKLCKNFFRVVAQFSFNNGSNQSFIDGGNRILCLTHHISKFLW